MLDQFGLKNEYLMWQHTTQGPTKEGQTMNKHHITEDHVSTAMAFLKRPTERRTTLDAQIKRLAQYEVETGKSAVTT